MHRPPFALARRNNKANKQRLIKSKLNTMEKTFKVINLKLNTMETTLKVIKQQDYDRYVFATYDNDEITGLNFHQGCDEIMWDYKSPCPALTDIFRRLTDKSHIDSEEERINKAIDLFVNAFIFQDEYTHNIPSPQLALIQKALKYYVEQYNKFNSCPTDTEAYEIFDMNQLSAMMNYQISITISEEDKDNFAIKNKMDFPQYKY